MANKYLARDDAPFGVEVWEALDAAMRETAKAELVGRRLLHVEGPFGLGLKAVALRDREAGSGLLVSEMLPVVLIRETFALGARDLASYEHGGLSLDTGPVAKAALACARREDDLVLVGEAGVPGLLTAEGVHQQMLSAWDEVGAAAGDLIEAVNTLDEAGFHGPYALALTPQRHNQLYRLYPRGNQSELDHIKTIATGGVYKAPALESGGVLLASGRQYASVVLGQDMSVGYVGPAGDKLEFSISESLTLRVLQPQSVCVLNA
jgi:uncharacterized linocin/CFP29 family protein